MLCGDNPWCYELQRAGVAADKDHMPYRYRVGQVVSAASAHAEPLHATFHESADPMILLDLDDRRIVDATRHLVGSLAMTGVS